jgi:oligopeptide transport system permease protein
MMQRMFRRFVGAILTLLAIYTLTFIMVIVIPINPFQSQQQSMAPEILRALQARYTLDNNLAYFFEFLLNAITLDFGPSFQYRDWTCTQIIADAFPVSLTLGLSAILLATLIGVPIGVISALGRHRLLNTTTLLLILIGISTPAFVTGTLLLVTFTIHFQWLPAGGWGTLAQLPLPAITLAAPFAAYIARLTRAGMLDAMSEDFVRTARAKGLPRTTIIWKHVFKIAFLPVLSYIGPASAQAMTGSFVVEKVFAIPGMGQHFVDAALNLDRGLILSTVLVYAVVLIIMNALVDALYHLVDPRIADQT